MSVPEIVVTSTDREKLLHLLETHTTDRDQQAVEFLDMELARARVVPPAEVPADVVTMNSTFRYVDRATGESRTVTLVYPSEGDPSAGRLSVLAPVGCALLGLAVGQTIDWPVPHGRVRSFEIAEVLHQPAEATRSRP